MTKIYDLIHLNNHIYMVDKEAPLSKGKPTTDGVKIYETSEFRDKLLDSSSSAEHLSTKISTIVASTDKSLGLPLLSDIEDWYLASKNYRNEIKTDNREEFLFKMQGFIDGYKAASAKKYTEEDMRKAVWKAAEIGFFADIKNSETQQKIEALLQSLNPLPKAVEVKIWNLDRPLELLPEGKLKNHTKTLHGTLIVDENNFVEVVKWIYE